jgi:MoxR-like ATPase
MTFTPSFFDPRRDSPPRAEFKADTDPAQPVYVYSDDIILAVNVAFAADRPLLITGPPGSGKSTLARNIAMEKGWRYISETITSRTHAADLQGRFDTVGRLNDAAAGQGGPDEHYIDPGVLWWAFDFEDAQFRGTDVRGWTSQQRDTFPKATYPGIGEPAAPAVVLLDEIDKAEPDIPNDLLEPLDRGTFRVKPTDHEVIRKNAVFIVITSNRERELPPAFLRRCVVLTLGAIDLPWLVTVAQHHFGKGDGVYETLCRELGERVLQLRDIAEERGLRQPSTAEYLNAIRACALLKVLPGTEDWRRVDRLLQAAVWKHDSPVPGPR